MTSPHVENDPLTATSWPADGSDSVLDPHTTEIPLAEDSAQVRRAVPKPPDVDEILRGEYTGWVPVIKAGESQVDAEERARARIRRIEAELDAEDDTGDARSVSMWMTESMAVRLPPVQQPLVTDQVVIPAAAVRPTTPDTVKAIHDILDPPWESPRGDTDRVLSPGEALDEARRRIRQMRVDIENNVEMVTRSFEHSVFQVPAGTGLPVQRLFDDPVLPDDEMDYAPIVRVVPAPATAPAPEPTPRVAEPSVRSTGPSAVAASPPAHVVPTDDSAVVAVPVIHSVADHHVDGVEMDAIADAIEAAMDHGDDDADGDLAALIAKLTKRAAPVAEPVSPAEQAPVVASVTVEPPAAVELQDPYEPLAEPGIEYTEKSESSTPVDSDAGKADALATSLAAPEDELETRDDAAPTKKVVADVPNDRAMSEPVMDDLRDALTASNPPPPAPVAAAQMDDSEAKFLSDLLSTIDEVEATVTQLANTTALDDVLAKYADILESDTSHVVTAEELDEAREVQQRAAEARTDLNAMLRSLKAAAGTLTDEQTGDRGADVAAVLEGLLSAAVPAVPAAVEPPPLPQPEPAQPDPARVRVVNQVVMEPADIDVPVGPDEPDLVRLVASALRPLDLPTVFRGEPKRMTAEEQERILKRHPQPPSAASFVREPGGKRADTPEESEIDKIIEAAADRGSDDRAHSFWDDEDADVVPPRPAPAREVPMPHTRDTDALLALSQPATTSMLSEQASQDHSLELVIMRDEITDLRDRLDSSQKLVEDLMVRLANLTEIALQHRSN